MKKIPGSVKDHISNARYYLEAASQFPSPARDAVQILLLLTAWENVQIAEEELHSWAQQTTPAKKLYTSHKYKFRKVRKSKSIDRIILGPPGTPAQTVSYASDVELASLLQICRYGPKTGSKELASIFARGWHPDDFARSLVSKIGWEEMMVGIYEKLPDYDK